MNFDAKLRQLAARDTIPLPQSYETRLQKVYASLAENPGNGKKRFPPSRLLLTAALVLCCIGLVAMGTDRVLPLLSGGRLVIRGNGNRSSTNVDGGLRDPIVLEDGKLWFTAGGEKLDLTGLVDENTPYIYTSTAENSNLTHYIAVGGTPEDFGWREWLQEDGGDLIPTISSGTFHILWLHEGQLYDPKALSPELQAAWDAEGAVHTGQLVYQAWYLSALERLGLEEPPVGLNDTWRGEPMP